MAAVYHLLSRPQRWDCVWGSKQLIMQNRITEVARSFSKISSPSLFYTVSLTSVLRMQEKGKLTMSLTIFLTTYTAKLN